VQNYKLKYFNIIQFPKLNHKLQQIETKDISCFRGWFTNNQSSTALIELQIYLFKLWIQRSNR